ncbi:MAG: peptidylprolyl isomerase [Candidatus Endonucleobacter sp. (ex Gigantidas childressi)]|nr:peptidylprolyl isomerase [Candidatus Endonucleobacter sp. (ex Gigantidas childressi)]
MMKGLKKLTLTATYLLALIHGPSEPVSAEIVKLDHIVAVVDGDAVMASELKSRIKIVRHQLMSRNITLPSEHILQEQVLEQLILENAQLQLGKKIGASIDDWALNNAISRIATGNNLSIEGFKKSIEADGLSFASAREEIRHEMIINLVRQRFVAERIHISDSEINNFLKSREGQPEAETEYRLEHILIAIPENASSKEINAAKMSAQTIKEKLEKGASFSEMAITHSKGRHALNGGDLGWHKADELPSLFAEEATKMKKGDISAPLRNSGGFHIIKQLDVRGNKKHLQEQVHVRHILVKPTSIRTNLEAQMKARNLYARIQKGENFDKLAKAHSDDTGSALNGGTIDWTRLSLLPDEFKTVINITPSKTVSEPFKTNDGWHILEVLGKRQHDISHQVRRSQAKELLGNRKFEEELAVWLRELRARTYVEIKLKQ